MNLADITTKCYILALIIRDDGERLLLGDGAYEFKDSQQHFIANTYANDVVELQGTDGQMLAGQVRRTATQTFSGYIGDATFSKQKIEAARRDFLMFFRKKHYYTAVYVFSDGTAIQRDRGYIVNAPSVPELYQRFPEWSVGLNFEDPNYYEYAEDDLGHEIAAHKVELELSTAMSGGLIWDGDGAVSDDLSYVGTEIPGEGKNFQLADTGTATFKSAELLGDTEQDGTPTPDAPQAVNTVTGEQTVKIEGKNLFDQSADEQGSFNYATGVLGNNNDRIRTLPIGCLPNTEYTISANQSLGEWAVIYYAEDGTFIGGNGQDNITATSKTWTSKSGAKYMRIRLGSGSYPMTAGADYNIMLTADSTPQTYEPYQGQTLPVNLGKNMFKFAQDSGTATRAGITVEVIENGAIKVNGTVTSDVWFELMMSGNFLGALQNTTTKLFALDSTKNYTLSVRLRSGSYTESTSSNKTNVYVQTSSSNTQKNSILGGTATTFTGADGIYHGWMRFIGGYTFNNAVLEIQLEEGNKQTAYAPYFTPIELAKIGTYQDRIYKNEGKWYIEKQIGKVAINITGYNSNYANVDYAIFDKPADALNYGTYSVMPALCESAVSPETTGGYNQTAQIGRLCSQANQTHLWIGVTKGTTQATSKTMLDGKAVYYALATPITTEITNSALVAQLERLQHSRTYADLTNFSITATSPNLPAFLKVVAFGDDAIPQGGYVWEDGGTGGATTITVDGVDNAQPIWTVVGPATNPSLTNITTGESIQWTGVVPNGQTLVVNMADMTASLSGANVFEFISGSWITLQAGNNRVSYSATAATGIATLEWNGVVG